MKKYLESIKSFFVLLSINIFAIMWFPLTLIALSAHLLNFNIPLHALCLKQTCNTFFIFLNSVI